MCGQLIGADGRVQIPGFYDDVLVLTDAERKQFASLPFSEAEFLKEVGSGATFGEAGFSTLERRWARPTCDINGLSVVTRVKVRRRSFHRVPPPRLHVDWCPG